MTLIAYFLYLNQQPGACFFEENLLSFSYVSDKKENRDGVYSAWPSVYVLDTLIR